MAAIVFSNCSNSKICGLYSGHRLSSGLGVHYLVNGNNWPAHKCPKGLENLSLYLHVLVCLVSKQIYSHTCNVVWFTSLYQNSTGIPAKHGILVWAQSMVYWYAHKTWYTSMRHTSKKNSAREGSFALPACLRLSFQTVPISACHSTFDTEPWSLRGVLCLTFILYFVLLMSFYVLLLSTHTRYSYSKLVTPLALTLRFSLTRYLVWN